jgi:hypothetical protein
MIFFLMTSGHGIKYREKHNESMRTGKWKWRELHLCGIRLNGYFN